MEDSDESESELVQSNDVLTYKFGKMDIVQGSNYFYGDRSI